MSTYTVKKGDTLSDIAHRVLHDWRLWPWLYDANKHTIADDPRNAAARRINGGEPAHWIFPGQVLWLP